MLKCTTKRRQCLTSLSIKKECINDELQPIMIKEELKDPQDLTHSVANEDVKEIQKVISNVNSHNSLKGTGNESLQPVVANNSNGDEIKIEKETLSEYIVTSPIIMPELNPPIPTHLLFEQEHSNVPPYECELCGHRVVTRNALYKHRLRKHNQKGSPRQTPLPLPIIRCHLCSKAFNTMSSLRQHIDVGHLNKSFVCEHCGHNLPTKNALCQHRLRKHRDIEQHQKKVLELKCTQCSETFNTSESLNKHKAMQHVKKPVLTETNPWFRCEDCGHKLPTKNALCQHRLRKHRHKKDTKNSYRCVYCKDVLPSKERLQSHLRESHEVLPALKQLVDSL